MAGLLGDIADAGRREGEALEKVGLDPGLAGRSKVELICGEDLGGRGFEAGCNAEERGILGGAT